MRIKQDHSRFRQIVRGRIRENLKQNISSGSLVGRQGNDKVTIPLPQIELPRFKFNAQSGGGVGQGDGEPGDSMGKGDPQEGEGGQGEAGPAAEYRAERREARGDRA